MKGGDEMNRGQFILPPALQTPQPTGVLDTPGKVLEASKELRTAVAPAFKEFDEARRRAQAEAIERRLD